MSSRSLVPSLALVLALTVGCGSSEEGEEGPEPGTGVIPDKLLAVEGSAEDAYDKALLEDFAAVAVAADTIDADWTGFRADAEADGAAAAELDAMDAAIAGLQAAAAAPTDAAAVGRAANAISAPMDELFALYDPPVPVAILALDYLGREVVLDGLGVDFVAGGSDVDSLDATWTAVRAAVVDAGGSAEADEYDASVAALRADLEATDEAGLIEDANIGLEIVDAIEGVFEP